MASLEVVDGDLLVKLSNAERLEAVHGDVRVPVGSILGVRTVADAWSELRGLRAPGTGWPGKTLVGTCRGGFGKDFVVVHGKRPAVIVELDGTEYSRIMVTSPDAEALADTLRARLLEI